MSKTKLNIRLNNTYRYGTARVLIYKDRNEYVGVCLEFDLVLHGKSKESVEQGIFEMVEGYLDNAKKNKLPERVLNRPAPQKYWEKYIEFIERRRNEIVISTKNFGDSVFSSAQVAALIDRNYYNGQFFKNGKI